MFRPEPRIAFLPALREQVSALLESINQPQIQIPGRAAQAAIGHLCGVRNGNGTSSVYVSLHLPATGENVVYVHEPHDLDPAAYAEAERDGLAFLESMGFMLDDLQFENLAPDAQAETLRRVPLFAAPAAAPSASTPPPKEPSAMARLLSNL
ncbi:MAG TPA: hypothetical protein VFK85_11950 [Anaeromyxobacteraceae bacterium]|nr:hypothetical protein [Anaeromyxobacteraceae bacterium]